MQKERVKISRRGKFAHAFFVQFFSIKFGAAASSRLNAVNYLISRITEGRVRRMLLCRTLKIGFRIEFSVNST